MQSDVSLLAGLLAVRARVRRRDRWSRDRLLAFQRSELARLLRHARARSPYYRDLLGGSSLPRLDDLPILTKKTLMQDWDRICTVPGLRLDAVERHLQALEESAGDPGPAWLDRWWLAATGGTTGRRAAFAWDRREWVQVLASYARVNDWAGVVVGLRRPVRTAIVSSVNPTHQSAVVGASLRSSVVPALRLDARRPIEELAARLNAFDPRLLVAYASMIGQLAHAQLEGSLRVHPERVVAASEVLGADARAAAVRAWGDVLVDTYAATETAGIASTCPRGALHLYEDLVVVEPVDEAGRAVPAGVVSDRVLVTVLFSRTLPLIRYELTDSVRLATGRCSCGLPFALLESVEGRTEETLTLPGAHGPVRVHPNVFHEALELLAPNGWQVEQLPGGLVVRLVGPAAEPESVRGRVERALEELGAAGTVVEVVGVASLERTRLGKVPLVKATGPSSEGDGRTAGEP